MLHNIILVIHVCTSLAIIGLVLLQHGKGADAGAAFGSGASATVFGARGSASFFSRATGVLAAVFFLTSLTLGVFFVQKREAKSVTDSVMVPSSPAVDLPPMAPAPAGDGNIEPPAAPTGASAPPVNSAPPVQGTGTEAPIKEPASNKAPADVNSTPPN